MEHFSQWLFAETHGPPFYVIEMLKTLLERSVLQPMPGQGERPTIAFGDAVYEETRERHMLPANIRELILARLSDRTSPAFALLAGGAVLGRSFPFEQAYQVAGLREDEGLTALDDVLAAHLLQETAAIGDAGQTTYFFTHDKIRDVVYAEAGDARRRVFHQRALACLQAGLAQEAELAYHARAAGLDQGL